MQKGKINIQDQFLNVARKEKVKIEVIMLTGEKLNGIIRSFDSFCVVLDSQELHLIYKHAIAKITFLETPAGIALGYGDD